jgi:hypothetical protein
MEITTMTYGGGDSWAAVSARLRVGAPRPFSGGVEVCPQRDGVFGLSVKTVSARKLHTDKNILGSPVSRPPV